ncbi:hypothetical protein QRZ34_27650 [Klebsiella michiganensis]|uniref:hypothetical protein n=1 Tax=Klebsiella michiganensis TaxID=1134687 RepID=UPI002570A218|nr:hypothetical protein [Klebsiella michiganensis]MDL4454805.1 hypothetical protein [Klebsiella michiganensis]
MLADGYVLTSASGGGETILSHADFLSVKTKSSEYTPADGRTHGKLEALERDSFLPRSLMDGMRFSVIVG